MKHLEKEWFDYRKRCVPAGAPDVQLIESRRAFMAGAWAFYVIVMSKFQPGAEAADADLDLMAALDREMREFTEQVKAGKA